jgi:RNA polymerase primary sigma factor
MRGGSPTQRAVEVLIADFTRQGGRLDIDQVNRVLERRGLGADQAAEVIRALAEEGVEITGVDPSTLGFEATRGVPSPSRARGDGLDALGVFLEEVARYRLLTAADERKLGRRIELGHKALAELERRLGIATASMHESVDSLARRFHTLEGLLDLESVDDADSGAVLVRQVRDGKDAFDHLLVANLRLVVSIAKRYRNHSLDLLDLIQEGCVGLIRAVEKFDVSLGYKFSTYATWWVRQAITRAIANQGSAIRLPVHVRETKAILDRTRRSLQIETGRDPTLRELAEQLQWDLAKVAAIDDLHKFDVTSLDAPVGSDGTETVGDFVVDPYFVDPADVTMRTGLLEALDSVLSELSDREREVLELRFGLDGGEARTLEEVGTEFGVTRERIRQIQGKALTALRHPSRVARLQDYVDRRPAPAPATEPAGEATSEDDADGDLGEVGEP